LADGERRGQVVAKERGNKVVLGGLALQSLVLHQPPRGLEVGLHLPRDGTEDLNQFIPMTHSPLSSQ
jgi:hypothetical protein